VGISTSPFIAATNFGTFIFFGSITAVGAVWVYFFVPETKGLSLEEMDEVFGTTEFATADLSLKAKIEADIGLTALLAGDDSRGSSLSTEKPSEAEKP
jgi:hypothetical protein